ncbi:MAG: hypothetical protein RJB66_1626 [Pseudomonadota bacterium]
MAGLTGLEPAASRVTGGRYNHLTTTPKCKKPTRRRSNQELDYSTSYTKNQVLQQPFSLSLFYLTL